MLCVKCGRSNPSDALYCTGCGTPLHDAPQSPRTPDYAKTFSDATAQLNEQVADALVGRTLDGRYRLDERIGVGGMGAVYVATRLHIGDTVAVKVLHQEHVTDRQSAERFRREAQMAARLKHPNAVSVYDFGITPDGLMYLVMEQVEGRSLRQIIKQEGSLTLSAATDISMQVCAALDEAHRQNIIHRDIKPDNIIVNMRPSGLHVKVLDFGIAKLRDLTTSNLTETGSVMGTPHYMSPEQCMGEELDSRSDIYSFGIVLYEMLCGVVPFNSPTSTAVVVQQVTQAPPQPRSIKADISPAVEAVLLHALEKRREARPQTAGALAQELSAAVHGTMPSRTTVPSLIDKAPTTGRTEAQPTHEMAPTIAFSTPSSGRKLTMPGGTGGQVKKRNTPLIVGGVLAVLIGIVAVAAITIMVMKWTKTSSTEPGSNQANTSNSGQAGNTQSRANNNSGPTRSASPQQVATESADDLFNSLSRRARSNPTPAEISQISSDLIAAETKYPTDYRFTYERARLYIRPHESHDEAFSLFARAGQKAIDNNRSDQMLSDLIRDGNSDAQIHKLTDHREWAALQQALGNRDRSALETLVHHH